MSSMAKIFVVVNLILGVAVFGAAATLLGAQDDWKGELEKASKQFEEYKAAKEKEIDGLNNQLAQQTTKAGEAVASRNQIQGERDDFKSRLDQAQNLNTQLRATVETLTKELGQLNKISSENKSWLDRLNEENKKATQEMLNAKKRLEDEISNRVQLEQQVSNSSDQIQDLSASKGDLDRQLREANFWLAEYKKRFGDLEGVSRGAQGRVLQVRGNLVVISVGSDDKVRAGDTYNIRRGATYVGQIRIDRVEKDAAVGIFDTQYTGDGAPPQKGDVAYPGGR